MNKTEEIKPFPSKSDYPHEGLTEAIEEWCFDTARKLSWDAVENLIGLVRYGPLYDGDVVSKSGRNELLRLGLCSKIVVSGFAMPKAAYVYVTPPPLLPEEEIKKGYADGYQAATYRGLRVYKALLEIKRIKP